MLKWILSGVIALVVIMAAPVIWVFVNDAPTPEFGNQLPWQVELVDPHTSRVFGLIPGTSTLNEAIARFGADFSVGIIHTQREARAIEAYFESASAGFITGKFIVTVDIKPDQLAAMAVRTPSVKMLETGARLLALHPDDVESVRQSPIAAIAFIPSADLDEEVVLQRFGQPAERLKPNDHIEHFLYPDKGLDIALDQRGKEILQYVAPRDFERLRAPLAANAADRPAQDGVESPEVQ